MTKRKQKPTLTEENRWVVSNSKMIKLARQRGLYKAIISLEAKKDFKLCPSHIYDLVSVIGNAINQYVLTHHEGELVYDEGDMYFMRLESLLCLLEDLLPHFFADPRPKTIKDNSALFKTLNQIRKIVAFPPLVEKFYLGYLTTYAENYRRLLDI